MTAQCSPADRERQTADRARPKEAVCFGPFRLDIAARRLEEADGTRVAVPQRALDLLIILAQAGGHPVSQDEITQALWPDRVVTRSNIAVHIHALRQALGGDWIRTIPRHGYVLPMCDTAETEWQPPTDRPGERAASPVGGPAVAVLPFTILGDSPEQAYLGDGIAEELIIALGRFRWFPIIARSSSFAFRGRAADVKDVGRQLGARYVLQGTVRRAGDRLRITGELAEAETGAQIWAEHYDGTPGDIFDLQDRIAAAVAGAMAPQLREAEIARARRKRRDKLDVYDIYLRALASFYRTERASIAAARTLLEEALRRDPDYAPAHALSALCMLYDLVQGYSADRAADAASAAQMARAAVARDRNDPQVLWQAGLVLGHTAQDWDSSLALMERSLALNPHSADAQGYMGWGCCYAGRHGSAIRHFETALRLSPLDRNAYVFRSGLAVAMVMAGRDEDAVAQARRAIQEEPNWVSSYRALAAALAHLGFQDDAAAAARQVLERDPAYRVGSRHAVFRPTPGTARYRDGQRKAGLPD